jgi:DNA-binding CsgD family transcriptional regulator
MTALLARRPVLQPPVAVAGAAGTRAVRTSLTRSEREVVALLADGHRPKQIARLRRVALSTVRSQIKAAKRKTGAHTIDELVSIEWVAEA